MSKSKIECFFLSPTEFKQISLRRYQGVPQGTPLCEKSGMGYHNAQTIVLPMFKSETNEVDVGLLEHKDYPHDDPRWPKACPCGYEFPESAPWQVNIRTLYGSPEMNGIITIDDALVGAMWYADWYDHKGPDGHCLVVRTPGGDWIVDYPCEGGRGWTRTGEPPKITARPSIAIGTGELSKGWKYHGFLTNGVLEEC